MEFRFGCGPIKEVIVKMDLGVGGQDVLIRCSQRI